MQELRFRCRPVRRRRTQSAPAGSPTPHGGGRRHRPRPRVKRHPVNRVLLLAHCVCCWNQLPRGDVLSAIRPITSCYGRTPKVTDRTIARSTRSCHAGAAMSRAALSTAAWSTRRALSSPARSRHERMARRVSCMTRFCTLQREKKRSLRPAPNWEPSTPVTFRSRSTSGHCWRTCRRCQRTVTWRFIGTPYVSALSRPKTQSRCRGRIHRRCPVCHRIGVRRLSSAPTPAIASCAVCPIVPRAAVKAVGHRAQAVVCGQHELIRLVPGQLWMVLHQACGYLSTRHLPNPQPPAHAVAVFQHRRIRSGDARRPYGGQEVRDGGASRRGQAYGDDGSNGTDEDFSDNNVRGTPFA